MNFNTRNRPVHIPDTASLFIDKIMLKIPAQYVQAEVAKKYLKHQPVHMFIHGRDHFYILIHPEFLPHWQSHIQRVWAGIIYLAQQNVFTGDVYNAASCLFFHHMYHPQPSVNVWMTETLDMLGFTPHQLEVTMDFYHYPAVANTNYDHFRPVGKKGCPKKKLTHYSRRDYRPARTRETEYGRESKGGKQVSGIIVYDAGTKHKLPQYTQRFEFCFTGRYTKHLSLQLLNATTSGIFFQLLPAMSRMLWYVTDPYHFNYYGYYKGDQRIWWLQELIRETGWDNYNFVKQKIRKKRKMPQITGDI